MATSKRTSTKNLDRSVKKMTRKVNKGLVNPDTGMRTAKGIKKNVRGQAVKSVAKRVGAAVIGGAVGGAVAGGKYKKAGQGMGATAGAWAGDVMNRNDAKTKAARVHKAANVSPFSSKTIQAYKKSRKK